MSDADLISLLRDALSLMGLAARVEPGDGAVRIAGPGNEVLQIRRGPSPTRWFITTARRTRPVPSVPALLEAVRAALCGAIAPRARIADGARFDNALGASSQDADVWRHAPGERCPGGDDGSDRVLSLASPAAPVPARNKVPVAIVTGFLGSGKTTLISTLLRSPTLRRTAVIVNEFGEIGLDHELIERGDETLLQLTNGCLCCAMQNGIADTLLDLQRRQAAGMIAFDHVIIETSGLADPAPILHAMMTDARLDEGFSIGSVITVVDAQLGETTLQSHPEARRQVEFADILICSKSDVVPMTSVLKSALRDLNPTAPLRSTLDNVAKLFSPHVLGAVPAGVAMHTPRVGSTVIARETAVPATALALFLQTLSAVAGARVLRLKGIVELSEKPGCRISVHGVQNIYAPPEQMAVAATTELSTRIVIIAQDMPPHFAVRLLDAIVEEVIDETARAHINVVSVPSWAAPRSAEQDMGRP